MFNESVRKVVHSVNSEKPLYLVLGKTDELSVTMRKTIYCADSIRALAVAGFGRTPEELMNSGREDELNDWMGWVLRHDKAENKRVYV
jgi:hypothetical protein